MFSRYYQKGRFLSLKQLTISCFVNCPKANLFRNHERRNHSVKKLNSLQYFCQGYVSYKPHILNIADKSRIVSLE